MWVRGRSSSLNMVLFDRSHTTFHWSVTVSTALSCTIFKSFDVNKNLSAVLLAEAKPQRNTSYYKFWCHNWNQNSDFIYTLCLQTKYTLLMFDNNFGRCGPIFKILSPTDSYENSLCIHHKDFHLTCSMLLPCEIRKLKNVTKFSHWTYGIVGFNVALKIVRSLNHARQKPIPQGNN